ncbi:MAG: hypothetical protein OXF22_04140 [Anaerolineaceae bacterium]|nr:hypothetical protein [Anaerolineaceae bacterium]
MAAEQHESITSESPSARFEAASLASAPGPFGQRPALGSPLDTQLQENAEPPQGIPDDSLERTAQLGIILIALGIISTLIGLFPGIAGSPPVGDVGQIQITVILGGFCLQIFGAWVYVRFNFYPDGTVNLIQQIGIRFTWTGLLFSLLSGFADILGFGSHGGNEGFFLGRGQALGLVGGFLFASIGLLIYALGGSLGRSPRS